MLTKVLVVCVGNICRSPTAQQLLKEQLPPQYEVRSAGVGALVDHPIDKTFEQLLNDVGIKDVQHNSQQINLDHTLWADLILVMEKSHIDRVCQIAPSARGKVHLLSKWLDDQDIPDPYKCSTEFASLVFSQLEAGASAWVEKLKQLQ